MTSKSWKVAAKNYSKNSKNWLLEILAKNRGLTTKRQLDEFLNPSISHILKVKLTDTKKAIERVSRAIKNKEKIIVYSDYDADGLCATAIVWETLDDFGANVMPYVPHRTREGYGLSTVAIAEHAKNNVSLIITVDHGITATQQIKEAQKLGIDVIVSDHHLEPKVLPKAYSIVHTTKLCGAGVAWCFCFELIKKIKPSYQNQLLEKLELAAIATIADLMPLLGANRAIVKLGLEVLSSTNRLGLKSLISLTGLAPPINSYEVGHIIAPRINAMGRLEHGIDSLRLLCTKNAFQADELARLLSSTNTKRQSLTTSAFDEALKMFDENQLVGVLHHESWHEGIIGLVASKLVEIHHKPMIAISQKSKFSKGSARSIPGFNIVDAIKSSASFLVDVGGHPMAAGFTIHTKHIEAFSKSINVYAQKTISEKMLTPKINVECELKSEDINWETLKQVKSFEPYGVGNPQPVFLTRGMLLEDVRGVGNNSQHLKLQLAGVSAIGFNMGGKRYNLRPGNFVDVIFTIDEDKFNGIGKVQIKIKDLQLSKS